MEGRETVQFLNNLCFVCMRSEPIHMELATDQIAVSEVTDLSDKVSKPRSLQKDCSRNPLYKCSIMIQPKLVFDDGSCYRMTWVRMQLN